MLVQLPATSADAFHVRKSLAVNGWPVISRR